MIPRAESAHWVAAAVALLIGLLLLAEAIVGTEVFRRRPWRAYLFPAVVLVSSVLLWVITVFSTFSTMHLLAHAVWAQAALLAGAVQLAVVRGKLMSPTWSLVPALALLVSGAAFLVHEQNDLFYSRSAFLHHAIGWMLVVASLFPLGQALRPRRIVWQAGFALTFVLLAVLLFADRDAAPIFGRYGIGGGP
jgi:ATP/ADP translocase